LAKITGIRLCQAYRKQHGCDYISAMPTNLYGVGDNYDLTSSHVIPALLRKAHEAKINGLSEIEMWGTGSPRREFLYVDDCADAVVFLMKHYSDFSHVNVGSGTDLPIEELALLIMKTIGIDNPTLRKDTTKPDGTPRKLMSGDMLKNMGWTPKVDLVTGILKAYDAFCKQQ
jgi:GDP-L-fucose synthase